MGKELLSKEETTQDKLSGLKSFIADQIMRRSNKDATDNIYAAFIRFLQYEGKEFWDKSFNGLKTEIGANRLMMPPHDDFKKGYNQAMNKALHFVEMYKNKEGLFQINKK